MRQQYTFTDTSPGSSQPSSQIHVSHESLFSLSAYSVPSQQLYAINAIIIPCFVPTFLTTTLLRYNLRASVSLTRLCNRHPYLIVEYCPPPGRNPGLSIPPTSSLR